MHKYSPAFTVWEIGFKNLNRYHSPIPVIQREVDIFKDHVWNSHRISVQKDTQLPNGASNHISSKNKGNTIFLSKGYLLIECYCHQFHLSVFFNQSSIKFSNYQTHIYQTVGQENSC